MNRHFVRLLTLFSSLVFLFSCGNGEPTPATNASTNPADCRIAKVLYGSGNSSSYDAYTYNAEGNVAKVDNYVNNAVATTTTYTYTNGLLTRQQTPGYGGIVYTYVGTDLTNAQLVSDAGTTTGNMAVTLDAAKRIATLTLKNLTGSFVSFEGLVATFTYDANGNCTQIDAKLPNGFLVQRTTYSNFGTAGSFYRTLKGLVFDPNYATTDFITYAPVWKFGPSAPNQIVISSFVDATGRPSSTTTTTTTRYSRTANQSGLTISRQDPASSNFYQYTGCQ